MLQSGIVPEDSCMGYIRPIFRSGDEKTLDNTEVEPSQVASAKCCK